MFLYYTRRHSSEVEDELFDKCGERGELDEVKQHVDLFDPDLDEAETDMGWTCVHNAAAHGNYEIVQFLVARGADKNKQDFEGRTGEA